MLKIGKNEQRMMTPIAVDGAGVAADAADAVEIVKVTVGLTAEGYAEITPVEAGALQRGDRVVVAASEGGAAAGCVLVLSAEAPTRVAMSSSSLRSDRLAVLRSCAASRRRPLWPGRNDDVKRSPSVKLMRQSGKQTPTGI